MIDFEKKALQNLETLSRIKCKGEEEEALFKGIQNILNYFEQLKEVDTNDVPACNFVLGDMQQNVMRKDEIGQTLSTDLFLSNAPDQVAGMIKVPTIIKEN
jgi:aspartyl-tRNA(Asn)/glutamyl-tRNA(Gln) amidotransferase subunit C